MSPGRLASQSTLLTPLAVALAIAGFVAVGCLWIDRPGLQYDEVLFVTASYPNPQRGGVGYLEAFRQPVCIMVLPYLGALKGWLYGLVFEIVAPSAAAVRVPVVLLGAFTLLLLFWFARRAFDARTGAVAVALAASDPAFLFTTRLDWGPVVVQRLCWLGGCLLLLRWHHRPTSARLLAAAAAFGVGLFDKLTFVWILAALLLTSWIVFPKALLANARWKNAAIAAAGLMLGCLPLLVYRLGSHPPSLGLQWETSLTPYLAKLSMLHHCLDGKIFQGWLAHVTAPHPAMPESGLAAWICRWSGDSLIRATWFPWASAASVMLLPWTLRTTHRHGLLFVFLFPLIAIAMMLPVASAGSVHHLTLVYPFPQLFVAASLAAAAAWLPRAAHPRLGQSLFLVLACLLVLTNLRAVAQQYAQILQFGGTPPWSEAIYELHQDLEARRAERVLVLDWGMATQLRLLSRGRLPLKEAPQPAGEERYFRDTVRQALAESGTVFVGYDSSVPGVSPRTRELLDQAVRDAGLRLHRQQLIRDLQGRPRFEIFAAE